MKIFVQTLLFLFCILQSCLLAPAQGTNALEVFKSFKGTWTIASGGKKLPFKMTYDLASKDSVVTELFGKELSVFYLDGESLLMTHYCNAGNHPRLKLSQNRAAGRFEFQMIDITNLKDGRNVVAPGRLKLQIVWKQANQEESENYELTRD
jgi:hypothetical protein